MRTKKYNIINMVKWFLPFYLFTFLPVNAQIGTWHNYMAYSEVQNICEANHYLFVLASNDLYQYNLNDQSIITYDKTKGLSDNQITHIAWNSKAKRLIAVYQNSNIDLIDDHGNVSNISAFYNKTMTDDKTVSQITIDDIYAWLHCSFGYVKVNMQKAEIAETYTPNHPDYPTSLPSYDEYQHLEKYRQLVATLNPGGPKYNHFYESKFANGKLYTTGGLFLSGITDLNNPGTIQIWDGNNWQIYQDHLEKTTGYDYVDQNCIDYDPTDPTHVAVGGRCGLYEFKDGKLLKYYHQENSPLRGAVDRGKELGNNYTLVQGLKYDKNGNLFVINSQAKETNLLEITKDGEWVSHYQPELTNNDNISFSALRSMYIDSRGLLWFVNTHWLNTGVYCYDFDTEDIKVYDDFINQDGIKYNISSVYCVNEDLNGNIWIGTDQGPFMIEKKEIGQESVTFQQIKVPRNDGTNYADYLLSGVSISSIAIDGGGRKWFATNGAGAFLISEDNMQQIHHVTTDNSKLLSNHITSVTINQTTGEVFFLTANGLCSYMSDATETSEDMTEDNVWAYPNPVTPDYTGLITIVGLSFNADVKILASNGALIAEGRSNGGTFTWDGCDKKGRRVASGIYMVVTAKNNGDKGTVCKIAIVN